MAIDFPANPTNGQVYANYIYDSSITAWRNVNTDTGIGTLNAMGLKNVVPASVVVGSGSATTNANGTVTFSGASSVSLNGVFTSAYANYAIVFDAVPSANGQAWFRYRAANSDVTTTNYFRTGYNATQQGPALGVSIDASVSYHFQTTTSANLPFTIRHEHFNPQKAQRTTALFNISTIEGTYWGQRQSAAQVDNTSQFDGFSILATAGTLTGTATVYGFTN